MLGRTMATMFLDRGDAWGDDGDDDLEQGGCLGGIMVRMLWNRRMLGGDDGEDVLAGG